MAYAREEVRARQRRVRAPGVREQERHAVVEFLLRDARSVEAHELHRVQHEGRILLVAGLLGEEAAGRDQQDLAELGADAVGEAGDPCEAALGNVAKVERSSSSEVTCSGTHGPGDAERDGESPGCDESARRSRDGTAHSTKAGEKEAAGHGAAGWRIQAGISGVTRAGREVRDMPVRHAKARRGRTHRRRAAPSPAPVSA